MVKFRTTVHSAGKNTAGFIVPDEIVAELGAGKKPPVKVTINDSYTYRTSIAVMGGQYMMSLSAANRAASGVNGGDEVDLEVVVDTEERKMIVPEDLAAALDADPEAKRFFESLSYSNQRRHIEPIEQAKTPETRQRRIEKSVAGFHEGRA
jgi:hypothetical protein